jgi:hypothetical protein
VRAPVELCFDLSVDVDVHQASVASNGERAVVGVTSGRTNLGDEVTWEARHLFKRLRRDPAAGRRDEHQCSASRWRTSSTP